MPVVSFDHVALPAGNPKELLAFYRSLGFSAPDPEEWSAQDVPFFSVHFGDSKINFHAPGLWKRPEFGLRGPTAAPGCGDLCFVWRGGLEALLEALRAAGVEIEAGPVERLGGRELGRAKGTSVYIRDPDSNLLEFIVYA